MRVIITSLFLLLNITAFAGQGSGGGLGKQLHEIALTETVMSASWLAEILDGSPELNFEGQDYGVRSAKLMESNNETPSGILIEVKPSDFDLVATDASNGKDFVYRDVSVHAITVDTKFKTVTMALVEDPTVIVVVKDAGIK